MDNIELIELPIEKRLEIYEKAIELEIMDNNFANGLGLCFTLQDAYIHVLKKYIGYGDLRYVFQEFASRGPKLKSENGTMWFPIGDVENRRRVLYEMINETKKAIDESNRSK